MDIDILSSKSDLSVVKVIFIFLPKVVIWSDGRDSKRVAYILLHSDSSHKKG